MLDTDQAKHTLQHTFRSEIFRDGDFHECNRDVEEKITFLDCSVDQQMIPNQEVEVPVGATTFGFEGVQLVFNCSRGKTLAMFGPRYELMHADE